MRRLLFILGLFLFVINATAQGKSSGALVKTVNRIENKYNVYISYDADINLYLDRRETRRILSSATADEALSKLTAGHNLIFQKLRDDYYVLAKNNVETGQAADEQRRVPSRVIQGTVYDAKTKEPIAGAVVNEKGSTNSTITDLDGKFTLNISDKAKFLVVSFMGYKKREVKITDSDNYEIYLEQENIELDAVVVSGVAGATPVKKLTVTVNKLDGSELNEAPASSAIGALQGKVPGVVVVPVSGEPGSGSAVRMRGAISMLGRNSPMIIVDGIIVQTSLADFNVDDIESMEIVKGAAASALYGSRAAGGVIVITTKRGKNIKNDYEVTIRNEIGNTQLVKYLDQATHHPYVLADDYKDYTYTKYAGVVYDDQGNVLSGSRILTDSAYADQPYAIIRNHQKEFFQKGIYFTNYASLASRAKTSNLFFSFENHHNQGIVFNTNGYTRRNFRFNADKRIGHFLKLSTSNLVINSLSDRPGSNTSFFDLLFINPDVDLTVPNDDGTPYKILPDPWSISENPLYPLYYRQRQKSKNSFMTDFKATLFLTEWLNLDAKYTFEKLNIFYNTYTPVGYLYGGGADIGGALYKEQYTATNQTFQTTANFIKSFAGFNMKAKLSYMYEDQDYYDFAVTGRNFMVPNIPQLDNTDPASASLNSYQGTVRAIDVFAIADIDYKSKYLFSGLFRRDGSSLFGANERWHNYFRVAAAYRITEDFKIPGFQELKIRAAYGTSGLRPGFSWQYETWSISSGILSKENLGNKDLKPAEARELEIALDAQLLKKIDLYASYSKTNTIGAFALAPLPSVTGYSYQWRNVGDIMADSWELSVGYMAVNTKSTTLHFRVNFDKIKQQMVSLSIPPYTTGPENAYYIEPGEPFGILYGYTWVRSLDQMANQLPDGMTIDDYTINSDGYVILKGTEGSTTESPVLYDADNDGTPDKVVIGDANPDFNMRFSTNLTVRNVSFYVLLDWKQGGDIYNYTHQYTFRDGRAIEFDQYGKPDELKKSVFYYNNFYQASINSYFVEDGTYLKIRELSVYYNLRFKNKLGNIVKSVKLGVIARNLYTFTNYTGFDPEVSYSGDLTTFAFDKFSYPNFRTVTASVQLKF